MRTGSQTEKEFLTVPLTPRNMTFYAPRSSILASVKAELASFYGDVLDVGCGFMPYRGLVESADGVDKYVGMDLESTTCYGSVVPDLTWDGVRIPCEAETFDCVLATEFLEHCSEPEKVLKEIHRVMKSDGIFLATVPFIWNLHEIPFDEYRYTPYSIERLLGNTGFKDIEVKALGGWNMALAQMVGLWLGFLPVSRVMRAALKLLLFPFFVVLVKTDKKFEGFDNKNRSMFNGLAVKARR